MKDRSCPKCDSSKAVKSGIINGKQRFRCKNCGYHFTVQKLGKAIDKYYVVKALQLYIEGVSYREIERILGVSHVSVMNWVRQYRIKAPENYDYRPTYKVFNHTELVNFMAKNSNLKDSSMLVTELGDKYMVIQWERFKHR
ncbi:IS1/IS1595 family N-terminal zinc-binding domain-containing protein [Lunatimonas salinarum]|uniref:IS1/IS1595 family N-terminal zinc-binding domain-containing protein n=1 Tax=Lunatimonas salinarum TaxID=1774590 RepID=UPI001AE00BCC|nr:helix-turn-helix domain-containing protein [Lunatimonas salinarum]